MKSRSRATHNCVVVLFSLLWSSAFVAGKIAVADVNPLMVLVLRFMVGVILLLPFCLSFAAKKQPLFDKKLMANGLLLGTLNNAVYLGLTFTALLYIPASLVVVIVSCAPFITLLLSRFFGLERIRLLQVAGIATGFTGVLIISGVSSLSGAGLTGIALAMGGTISFAVGTVYFRGRGQGVRLRDMNFWQSVAGVLVLAPFALNQENAFAWPSASAWLAIAYLALVVTVGGMALWFWLIKEDGPTAASSYHLMNPMFGVLLSSIFLGTSVTFTDLLGSVVIGLGLFMTMQKR